jgi:diaminohydroxyphosphoribosylaminopyrimidine deaminase/5-amino-6-(5-phosphoribosylamino)uracil reductase
MRRALLLAARGRGRTSPNPMVGATIVDRDGTVIGDGWHQQAGTPHAEIHALAAAGARSAGATLICTLEPCSHHGRTGPCVDAILAAGIARVVAAVQDPNPQVAGQGLAKLEAAGVEVIRDVERAAATALNAPFFAAVRNRRPWVIAKAGVSGDGKVAAAVGARTAITSEASRRHAQRRRAEVDAVAVGINTVLVDDPLLTVRDVYRSRPLTRVVFDRALRTPPTARLFSTTADGPVVILTAGEAVARTPERVTCLERAGAVVLAAGGSVADGLGALHERGIQSVVVEGGPGLHRAFAEAGMIDMVELYIAPAVTLPGGVPLALPDRVPLAGLHDLHVEPIGDDVVLRGYVHRPH